MLWEEYRQLMEYGFIGIVILFQIVNKILSFFPAAKISPVLFIVLSSL
jgi:hypothetical protein